MARARGASPRPRRDGAPRTAPRERRPAAALLAALLAAAGVVGACGGPVPPSPSPTPRPTPSPTASPGILAPAEAPPGTAVVEVPAAGIALPVPAAWTTLGETDLAEPGAVTEALAGRPGALDLLGAAEGLGDRATLALLAVDGLAPAGEPASNLAVLVAGAPAPGPLLDLVAGFIGAGFEEMLAAVELGRERLVTPVGDAIRIRYGLPAGGEPGTAEAWVLGTEDATILLSFIGVDAAAPDPAALLAAAVALP